MNGTPHTTPRAYEAPRLKRLGDFSGITLGLQTGDFTDAVFPINTPKKDLKFS